jgi:4-hydroxy-tetrahydrodipicolinate synthase
VAHSRRLLDAGCDGVTLFGTTGEGPAFTVTERKALLEAMLSSGIRADQIIVTITALALGDAIELGRHGAKLGVRRQMLMPPFYFNQPRDAGIVEAVSQVVRGIDDKDLRLLLYHFPVMSSLDISHLAIAELVRRHPNQLAGVKDSSGERAHSLALTKAFPALAILVGMEPDVTAVMLAGGSGAISGLANIAPRLVRRLIDTPADVSKTDLQLMSSLLSLLGIRPDMPFVGVYKVLLAQQSGDDFWLNMRAPLSPLDQAEEQAVRQGYHALGELLKTI